MNFRESTPIQIQQAFLDGTITREEYFAYMEDVGLGVYDNPPPRFIEEGNSVIFPRNKARHHISFVNTYRGMTIPEARRKMRFFQGHSMQNDMIHYLKYRNLLKV